MNDLTLLLHSEELKQSVKTKSDKQANFFHHKGFQSRELCLWASSLARLLEGGVPLLQALASLQNAVDKPRMKQFLQQLEEEIRQGKSLSESLRQTRGTVPFYLVQLVSAGEVSGTLPEILKQVSRYLEKEEHLRRKLQEALAYPAFILATGIATLAILMRFVIPKLAGVYSDFGAQLPFLTRSIISISEIFPFAVILFSGAVILLIFAARKNKKLSVSFLRKVPLAGKLYSCFILIRFSSLMSLLMRSGVTALESLDMTGRTFSDPFVWEDALYIRQNLTEGKGFTFSLSRLNWIDPISKMLAASGEESGRLPEAFGQIAQDAESRMESEIQWMLKLAEPTLILGVGLIVGIVVIGTILPVFDISGLMQ